MSDVASIAGRFTERQRQLLRSLRALAAERVDVSSETEQRYRRDRARTDDEHETERRTTDDRFRRERAALDREHRALIAKIQTERDADYERTQTRQTAERERITEKASRNEEEAKKQLEEAVWLTETVFEASEHQPLEQFRLREKEIEGRRQELELIAENARTLMGKYRQRLPDVGPAAKEEDLDRLSERAQSGLLTLSRLRVARMFRGLLLPVMIVVVAIGAGVATAGLRRWQLDEWGPLAGVAALLTLAIAAFILYTVARRRTTAVYRSIVGAVQTGDTLCNERLVEAQEARHEQEQALIERRDRDLVTARETYEPILETIRERRAHHLERIESEYPKRLETLRERKRDELEAANRDYETGTAALTADHEAAVEAIERRFAERSETLEQTHTEAVATLERRWCEGMARCATEVGAIRSQAEALFRPWDDAAWETWSPPTDFAPSVRFGSLTVDRSAIPGSIPDDERLRTEVPDTLSLPATLDFPEQCSLLLLADADHREQSVLTLQAVMLRLLTALPPGKVRFTILDPVGLGQNFAGFMHLADYEESFVASRIWTETRHIEQRLADLTEHMENVIQKYLRNEFETIAQYNVHAGEIAEPYRFVVISDFPASFSETAARRLASVLSSGARCGVHTLMTADPRQAFPRGIDLRDLERHSTTLVARDDRFVYEDEDFQTLPLALEPPPPEDLLTRLLHRVGEASRDATRVEVPFRVVAPVTGGEWRGDCTRELTVPLGRAGATKLQQLAIGTGTAQHALVAGKTGSGKSTLLHVIITNLALWYSPEEVEFYLVDFKKGVEFKTYAVHRLPHARAVAIESDREFGLSVLQRIDAELRRRGDRFRDLGVQDLAGYRRLGLDEPMPRTLLVIDEFQEMFVEDDKLGQDAALLMDRLVRQGRAFGIHVLLGSQTLGGAYTLARSTMGQMQVRIALQCTEADSYLIMSDDNAAARLLSRPGEAIYNDAGGAVEGNNPFQIVWLPDEERDQHLARVAQLGAEAERPPEPMIVFEGNAPADFSRNHELETLLRSPTWPEAAAAPRAWLGEAVAIKGPTAAALPRQSGSNLLIVGQREEAALAMTTTAVFSLAAHTAPEGEGGGPRFYVLDGSPANAPNAGYLERVLSALPHDVRNVAWRDVDAAIAEIAEELKRRQADDASAQPPIYLVIYGLQRFRMLRTVDDFSFSMSDDGQPPSTEKLFAEVLRDGSPLGIHTITWCDTATNLNRTLDRNGLREFERRVLFQMSAADSTQLVDSPLAGKLGLRRALFHNEEEGIIEKFRPYAPPDERWLGEAAEQLKKKV